MMHDRIVAALVRTHLSVRGLAAGAGSGRSIIPPSRAAARASVVARIIAVVLLRSPSTAGTISRVGATTARRNPPKALKIRADLPSRAVHARTVLQERGTGCPVLRLPSGIERTPYSHRA